MVRRTSLDGCYGYTRGIFKQAGEYRFIFAGIYILFARYRYHARFDFNRTSLPYPIDVVSSFFFTAPIQCKIPNGRM